MADMDKLVVRDLRDQSTSEYDIKDSVARDELSNVKADLKSEIIQPQIPETIVQGTFDYLGNVVPNNSRIRVSGFFRVQKGARIDFTGGTNTTQILLGIFDDAKVYQRDSQWYSSGASISVENDGYYIFVFRKNANNQTITPSEYDATTTYYPQIGNELDKLSDAIDVLETDLKWFDAVPISTFDKSMFEKGNIANGKKDTYRENVRIRSTTYLYSLQAIDVSKKNRNSNATFDVIIYDNAKNVILESGWKTSYRIPKGVVFNVIFTSTNASTSETLTVDEIYNLFDFVPVTTNVVEDTNDAITAKVGLFNSSNDTFESFYPTRVSILDFIKCDNRLMKVQLSNGYKCFLIGYDKEFNLVEYDILGAWIYNLQYVDVSKYSYIRVGIANSTDTALNADEALNNITIEKSVPLVSNYFGKTVDSFSKDGINQERKSYAPMYPQSSIVSFQKAFDQGFRSLMMHVQFTADNEMVLLHDVVINYSAVNVDGTDISESLRVDQLTLEQLDNYDFGLKFGEQYKGTKITRFAEGLMFAKKHNMDIFIEPTLSLTNEKAEMVCNLLKKYGYLNNVCYFSYRYVELEYVHTLIPNMDLSLSVDTVSNILSWADRFASLKTNNRLFFYEYASRFTDEVVETLSEKGIEAMVQNYTDNEPENLIALINENPYITRVVSQIIPANIAILQNQ